jgi:hypothetical protein
LITLLSLSILFLSTQCTPMNLTLLNATEYPGARCLDGSQAGMYTQEGWGTGADKYIIYF